MYAVNEEVESDRRKAFIVPLHKVKGDRGTNYKAVILLSISYFIKYLLVKSWYENNRRKHPGGPMWCYTKKIVGGSDKKNNSHSNSKKISEWNLDRRFINKIA